MRNSLVLGLSLDAAGHHPAAWRLPLFDARSITDIRHYLALGLTAQSVGVHFLLAGHPVRSSALAGSAFSQSVQFEPLSLVSALMSQLSTIGLVASVPMAYWEPFNVARAFSALDNLSAGRAGWLAVPASEPVDEQNFPRFAHQHIDAPYERASEFAELVRALWDSWEDDALKFDKENAIFTDRTKVHRIGFHKKYFASDGPLNAPRPVQGHPPIFATDLSDGGLAFAAANADLVIGRIADKDEARALRARITALASGAGRAAPLVLPELSFVLGGTEAQAREAYAELEALSPQAPADRGYLYVGTAAGLADFIITWFEDGCCDGFQLLPSVMPRDLDLFATGVAPLLRARGLLSGTSGTLRERLGLERPAIHPAQSTQGEA